MLVDQKINNDMVSWHYQDHPVRWLIAFVAGLNWMINLVGAYGDAPVDGVMTVEFFLGMIRVIIWLFVFVVCVLPKVDGVFIRRGMHFEIDLGRRTFDFMGGFSEFLSIFSAKEPLAKVDIGDMNRRMMNRFFPRRIRYTGDVGSIVSVSPAISTLGPALTIETSLGWLVKIDDLQTGEMEYLLSQITRIKNAST